MGKTRLFTLIVGCMSLCCLMAGAQEQAIQGAATQATAAQDATTTEPGARKPDALKFTVNIGGDYTDNRDSSPIKQKTFDLYVGPRLDATAKWADDSSATFFYAPTYRYMTDPSAYQNKSELFHDLGLDLRQELANVIKVRVGECFNYTDDPSVQAGEATLRSDASFILNRVAAGATYLFSPLYNLDVHGENMLKRYSDSAVAQNSDEDSTSGGATLWRQVNNRFGVSLEGNAVKYGYNNSLGLDRGFTTVSGGLGVDGVFSPNFRAGLHGGVTEAQYEDSALASASSPYVNFSLQALPIPATRISASVSHSIQQSDIYPFASQKNTAFVGSLDWDAVPSRMTLTVSGTYQIGKYSEDSLPLSVATTPAGDRDSFAALIAATFKLNKDTSVTLSERYEDVTSSVSSDANDPFNPFTKNTVTVTVSRVF